MTTSLSEYDEEFFNERFVGLATLQSRENIIYKKYIESLGIRSFSNWREVSPIPVTFFKEFQLRSYDLHSEEHYWESSGTTGTRSRAYLKSDALYNAVIQRLWTEFVPQFDGITYRLIPNTREWPTSSLAHFFTQGNAVEYKNRGFPMHQVIPEMNAWWRKGYEFDDETNSFSIKLSEIVSSFIQLDKKTPLRFCGTSYAIATLFDYMERENVCVDLPEGSTIIDTGGYKGLVRDRSRKEFLEQAEYYLGISVDNCYNEYGMSELSSHFWSSHRVGWNEEWWQVPPWVRVRSVDSFTLEDKECGVGVFYDLANVWSCCAIQTQDIIEVIESDGLQFIRPLGRVKESELKGCSITAEQVMK